MIIILSLLILLQFRFFDTGLPRLGRSWSLCPYAYLMCIISLSWRKIAKSLICVVTNGSKFRSAFLATLYFVLSVFLLLSSTFKLLLSMQCVCYCRVNKTNALYADLIGRDIGIQKITVTLVTHKSDIIFASLFQYFHHHYCINLECMHMQCTYIYSCELHELLLILHAPQA